MAKKHKKTNAMRILDVNDIEYETKSYDFDGEDFDGNKVARQVGLDPDQVFKTLITEDVSDGNNIFVCVVPVNKHLDLKALATKAGIKKLDMIPVDSILKITGYLRGGCSPIGLKKDYPTYIDNSALEQSRIAISAGLRGMQIFLDPKDLIKVTNAELGDFATEN